MNKFVEANITGEIQNLILSFLESAGLKDTVIAVTPILYGGNNRVFKVETENGCFLLKSYFSHHEDKRDRLNTEFDFLSLLWEQGIRKIPKPIAKDSSKSIGLYEFIEGTAFYSEEETKPCSGEVNATGHFRSVSITEKYIQQAIEFALDINHPEIKRAALDIGLPLASEACFSIKEHILCVDRRLQRLKNIDSTILTSTISPVLNIPSVYQIQQGKSVCQIQQGKTLQQQAHSFVQDKITPAWEQIKNEILNQTVVNGMDQAISFNERCLSPSDFGFHNAIMEKNDSCIAKKNNNCVVANNNNQVGGTKANLKFIDFEYAGWDDPAKMICDFFCQPKVPVPFRYCELFIRLFSVKTHDPTSLLTDAGLTLEQRVFLLFPLFRIKWCCIMLNDFLTIDNERRMFALSATDVLLQDKRKKLQLLRSVEYFNKFVLTDSGS